MARFLLVCLGGALGSGARYLTSIAATSLVGIGLPYGTIVVNLAGSLVMGAVIELLPPGDLRIFLATGLLGGFTTYSSFNEETLLLLRSGAWGMTAINVAVTFIGCLAAGAVGIWVARAMR
jgi:CrcB protein